MGSMELAEKRLGVRLWRMGDAAIKYARGSPFRRKHGSSDT